MKFHINDYQQVECTPGTDIPQLSEITLAKGLSLFSVIKRFKQGRSKTKKHLSGDNCPFLYGLKNLDGLSVAPEYQQLFYQISTQSVRQYFRDGFPFDCIMLLPSSHGISRYWVEQFGYDVPVLSDVLRKKTNQEIKQEVAQYYENRQIDKKIYEIIVRNCEDDEAVFSLKNVPVQYRAWVKPFALSPHAYNLSGRKILLVDDICSSGTSLVIAADLIRQYHYPAEIAALTLFGKVPK